MRVRSEHVPGSPIPATGAETRYRELFESALIGIYVSLPDGQLLDCNQAFARLIGFDTVAAAVGADMRQVYPSVEARAAFVDAVRGRRRLEAHRTELRRRDGAGVTVLETAVGEFSPSGELLEIRGYVVDITESVRMESALRQTERLLNERIKHAEKIESIGRLAGGIAHDYNNLLTAIIGYTELLLSGCAAEDPNRRDLEEIYRAGQRASVLTQQLLAFSRKQVLLPKALDLNEIVVGLQAMLGRVVHESITLRFEIAAEPAHVLIDRAQIEQAIINLVLNARDALPSGGDVTVDVTRVPASEIDLPPDAAPGVADYVRLRVRDTGAGIPPEVQAHLFEPFFTTKELGKGTGLGLASVHGIVMQSNGFINVTTAAGAGATFAMHFPAVAPPGPVALPAGATIASGGPGTILLVEDEDAVRAIVSAVLRRQGYRVIEASAPSAAIELFEQAVGQVDLLLTDVVMPEMNGPALAQRLVAMRPELRVLFISGYADFSASPLDPGNPNIAYLSKPFQASALKDAVRTILSRSRETT